MYENSFPEKRFNKTLEFLTKHVPTSDKILDLGVANPFSKIMQKNGYKVSNTNGEDLDNDFKAVQNNDYDCVTAFEIFEHLLAPYNILREIKANKLVASVPLKLWFAPAYRSKTDKWDRHYHEFEAWQFDWLLEKSGWKIKDSVKWSHPVNKIGLRPLLRTFTPRYYAVYAEKI
ncbi:methyltransferase [Christiangramia aquimixticola]|uniref:methyltransferase n=1 Tax=Christiangramia aquimixticola TaxID=1697558 RepID=UPI003AA8CC34